MILWNTTLAMEAARPPAPAVSIAWRCSNCGTEGVISKGPNANETLRRMIDSHERLARDCAPRLVVVDHGHTIVITG
jgi:hypothetical protein